LLKHVVLPEGRRPACGRVEPAQAPLELSVDDDWLDSSAWWGILASRADGRDRDEFVDFDRVPQSLFRLGVRAGWVAQLL
jgi:hypothetical protein